MTARSPVKVLYCEHNRDGTVGGSYYSLLYLVSNLSRSRFSPTVLFYKDHELMPAFRSAGVETLIWRQPTAFTFANRFLRQQRYLGLLPLLLQKLLNAVWILAIPALRRAWFLWRNGFEIVHLNNSLLFNHDWMVGALLARKHCVTHERGIFENYDPVARFFARRLDAVICISEAVRSNLHECGVDFGNLTTIYNGLDPAAMKIETAPDQLRQRYGVPPDAIVVGMLANLLPLKGHETLIRAIGEVRQRHPSVWCFLVGEVPASGREYQAKLHEVIGDLGLTDRVVFTGFQRNVADFLMMFDIAVLASVVPEGFGRVVLEAMAFRKPFIGPHLGAIPEVVDGGRAGLTFPPGDATALARAIEWVIANPAETQAMVDRGYQRLISDFAIQRNTKATEGLYDRILG